ncbi:hypothetical protein Tco_1236537 [Tanacetum coccineum]
MASESTSSQQTSQLSPSSKVNFRCKDDIIAFNNIVSLLEHSNDLYRPMLDEATKTITFLLSSVEKPLTFTQDEFISAIGLPICSNAVPLPHKETVRAGLATLGLFDKDKPNLSSLVLGLEIDIRAIIFSELVNKLQNKKKKREANICYIRFLSLMFEKLLGDNYINAKLSQEPELSLIHSSQKVNADDTTDKSSSTTSVQPVTQPKAPTNLKSKKKKIPPSSQPKSSYKVKVILPKTQVVETLHAEKPVATTDATKSLDTSESVQDQNIQEVLKESGLHPMEDVTFDQIMDEIDHKNKDAEKAESFETLDSADNDSQEGTAETFHAFAHKPAQLDPLGRLPEELCTLNTKVNQLESSITNQVTDAIQSFVPSLVADTLKAYLPGLLSKALKDSLPQMVQDSIKKSVLESIEENLPLFDAPVQETLKDQLPNFILKPMHREFNAFNKLKSLRFVMLQKELRKVIKKEMRVSVNNKVRKGMEVVFDKLASVQSSVATNSQHVQDMVSLLEALKVFKKANVEGEKKKSEEDTSEKNVSNDEPHSKKLKFLIPTSSIPSPTPLKFIMPEPLQKPNATKMTMYQFTKHLTNTTSSIFSPYPPRDLTRIKQTISWL